MSTANDLIAKNPHLTPSGQGMDSLVLAAKNLRAELKNEGITASVRTERYAGGNCLHVNVLDPDHVERAKDLADQFRVPDFDYDEADEVDQMLYDKRLVWASTYGQASHTSSQEAWGETREKLLGTYQTPPKQEPTIEDIEHKFKTGIKRGTPKTISRNMDLLKTRSDDSAYNDLMDSAWVDASYAYAMDKRNSTAIWSIRTMLDKGHDPDSPVYKFGNLPAGGTALHLSSFIGDTALTSVLLDAGADPNHKNDMGQVPQTRHSGVQELLDEARVAITRQRLADIAVQHRPTDDALKDHSAQQAINRADRDGSTDLMHGATLHTAANLADAGYDTAQAPYWLAQRGQEPSPITGAADPSLRPHVAVDERVAVYDQEIAVASTPATLSPGHRQEELASVQQVQAKRKAYGRAM